MIEVYVHHNWNGIECIFFTLNVVHLENENQHMKSNGSEAKFECGPPASRGDDLTKNMISFRCPGQ